MKNKKVSKVPVPAVVILSFVILAGIALIVTGVILGNKSEGQEGMTYMFIFDAIGSFLTMGGIFGLLVCFMPLIARKMTKVTAPITKQYMNDVGIPTADTIIKDKIKCPYCQEENPSTATYCSHCGKPLYKICPHCSTKNPGEAEFCNHCGERLD